MNRKKDFLLKYASEADLIKIKKKVTHAQVKHNEPVISEGSVNQLNIHSSGDTIYSLHDPYDLNHIHGLRNRLFKTFNEFSKILNNTLDPPVIKTTKKVQVKNKESDQQTNTNYISDLNLLLTEIKKESKSEILYTKKDKTNIMLKRKFQIKLIQSYKLLIDTIQLCTKTLEAGIYNPIQSKMKNLIQIVSNLSFVTGKYLYGALFKKKKKESFDLVQQCKVLEEMLDECGYQDTDNENDNNIQHCNVLNELAKKTLIKNKTQSFSANSKYSDVYMPTKLKLGSCYANKWSNKSLESTENEIDDNYSLNKKDNDELPISSKKNQILYSHNEKIKLDEIKTKIEDHLCEEIDNNCKETEISRLVCNNEVIDTLTSTKTLKLNNNVGLFIMKQNIWRSFPIKNLSFTQTGCLCLYVSSKNVRDMLLYKQQFKQTCTEISLQFVDVSLNVTESIMDDLIKKLSSKLENKLIYELPKMETFY